MMDYKKMMDNKGLVSVIIPCYNGGKVVHRLLDSLLAQTYRKLEIVFVNDGSTDDSEEVVKKYIPQFERQSMLFKYIFQKNQGLGGAINTGLAHMTGEYFIWPDADDMLTVDSIEKRIDLLIQNPDVALVTSNAFVTNASDPYVPVRKMVPPEKNMYPDNLFEDYLYIKGAVLFCCGSHMMRTSMFEQANHGRDIYPMRRGQNWQLLLPVLYKYKRRIWMDIPLYYYVVSSDSMSHTLVGNFQRYLDEQYEHEKLLIATLSRFLDDTELTYYKQKLGEYYAVRVSILYLSHLKFGKFIQNIADSREKISVINHLYSITCKVTLWMLQKRFDRSDENITNQPSA